MPGICDSPRKQLRVRVIFGEPIDVVLQRVHTSRGDDAGLAHRAAEDVFQRDGTFR